MRRQRIRIDRGFGTVLGQLVVVLVALVLLWAGAVLLALALKADPEQVASASGYREVYDAVVGFDAGELRPWERVAWLLGGLLGAAVLVRLALAQLPKPHLTRAGLTLAKDDHGAVTVGARAIERAAEAAALSLPAVKASRARLEDDVVVLAVRAKPKALPATLAAARDGAVDALRVHGLPDYPVRVVAARIETTTGRDLA